MKQIANNAANRAHKRSLRGLCQLGDIYSNIIIVTVLGLVGGVANRQIKMQYFKDCCYCKIASMDLMQLSKS